MNQMFFNYWPIILGLLLTQPNDSPRKYLEFSKKETDLNDLTILWEPGQEVWIKFIGGSTIQRSKVRLISLEWTRYANLKFVFKTRGYAHIRISFNQDDGHWSLIGRRSTLLPQNQPTMNIALNKYSDGQKWKRVVLHEFGHLLGLKHEHQNPCDNPIKFTSHKDVIKYYQKYQGWDEETIRHNVLNKVINPTYCWPFDPESIMLYPISENIRRDNLELLRNNELSEADKAFIRMLYP